MVNPFAKGQGAFIKITSLTVGLTVGLVLLAKVQLERNYDRCIVDKEHVYELQETFQRTGEEMQQFAYKVALPWTVFALDALIIILIIAAVVFIQTRRVANDNPVEYLKKE